MNCSTIPPAWANFVLPTLDRELTMSLASQTTPQLSHFGIYVHDVEAMTRRFYTIAFDLRLTDRGIGRTFKVPLHFLSGSADQHHQLVLAGGRGPDSPSTVMQMSFKVGAIDDLRRVVRALALAEGASAMRGMNHGNALSIIFSDIEGDTVEVYLDAPLRASSRMAIRWTWRGPTPRSWADDGGAPADPGFTPAAALGGAVRFALSPGRHRDMR